jgi:transcriptional regulator with XRE-family HTH domain
MISDAIVGALYDELGRRVRRWRERQSMTQDRLATAAGVSRSSVANIEAGRQATPLHVVLALAEVLQCELADLIPSHDALFALETARGLTPQVVTIGGEHAAALPPQAARLVSHLLSGAADRDVSGVSPHAAATEGSEAGRSKGGVPRDVVASKGSRAAAQTGRPTTRSRR